MAIEDGIVTALVTPFKEDGTLDLQSMRDLVEDQVRNGIHGICALGGTGEPLMLSVDERKAVIDAVVDSARGRASVIVGSLVGSQPEIIEVARHARAAGADAVMVMAPYFVMPTPDHVLRHLAAIADAVDMPQVLFNTPTRSGIRLDSEFICRLVEKVGRIVGIKEATGDLGLAAVLTRELGERCRLYQGYDDLVLQTLAIGGHGAMVSLGNLIPDWFVKMYDAATKGNYAEARRLQLKLLPLVPVIYAEPNPGPLKWALTAAGKPGGGPTRPPIYPISQATKERLLRALRELALAPQTADVATRSR